MSSIRITERLGGGEPLRTAYAVAEPNQHRAIALFKLRPDHSADEQVEAVVELSQSALDSLGLKPGMIKPRWTVEGPGLAANVLIRTVPIVGMAGSTRITLGVSPA